MVSLFLSLAHTCAGGVCLRRLQRRGICVMMVVVVVEMRYMSIWFSPQTFTCWQLRDLSSPHGPESRN